MTGGSKGFFVGGGTSRPTRIPVPMDFKALSADTGGQYSFGEHHLTERQESGGCFQMAG